MSGFLNYLEDSSPSIGWGSIINEPSSDTTNSHDPTGPVSLPDLNLILQPKGTVLPYVRKKYMVKIFKYNENPIYCELDDGTKLFFSRSEYERIKGDMPIIPKLTELEVSFLRLPTDNSPTTSKVAFCKSRFKGDATQRKIHNIYTANLMTNNL